MKPRAERWWSERDENESAMETASDQEESRQTHGLYTFQSEAFIHNDTSRKACSKTETVHYRRSLCTLSLYRTLM